MLRICICNSIIAQLSYVRYSQQLSQVSPSSDSTSNSASQQASKRVASAEHFRDITVAIGRFCAQPIGSKSLILADKIMAPGTLPRLSAQLKRKSSS